MKTAVLFCSLLLSIITFGQLDSIQVQFDVKKSMHHFSDSSLSIKIPIKVKLNGKLKNNLQVELKLLADYSDLKSEQFVSYKIYLAKEVLSKENYSTIQIPAEILHLKNDSIYNFFVSLVINDTLINEKHYVQLSKEKNPNLEKLLSNRDTIPIGELSMTNYQHIPVFYPLQIGHSNNKKQRMTLHSTSVHSNAPQKRLKIRDYCFYRRNSSALPYALINKNDIAKKLNQQNALVKSFKDNSDTTEKIRIEKYIKQLTDSSQKVEREISISSIVIDDVHLVTSEGRIANITVSFKEDKHVGYYVNKGPISLTNFKKKRYYKLFYIGSNPERENTFIILSNFLNYNPSTSRHFIPSDVEIHFDKNEQKVKLYSPANPLTFFDARVYTDAKGLSGEENGLVQTDLNARFIGNTNALGRSYLTFFQYVNVGVSYSKFDSQFDTLHLNSLTDRSRSELLRVNQFSNTAIRIETDFLRGSRVHDAYLKVGHLLTHTKISAADSSFSNVFTPSFYLSLGGTLHAGRRIRADFKLPLYASYLMDQPFTGHERKFDYTIIPEVEFIVQINKDNSNSLADKPFVFARIRYFDMPWTKGNNFWQIQTGVQVPITNLIKN